MNNLQNILSSKGCEILKSLNLEKVFKICSPDLDKEQTSMLSNYIVMPIVKINSINEMKEKLNMSVKNLYKALQQVDSSNYLREIGYNYFFEQLKKNINGSPSYRSRYRIVLSGDSTLTSCSKDSHIKVSTKLYDYVMDCYIKGFALSVLMMSVGDTKWNIPIDYAFWLPKHCPGYTTKLTQLCEMAEKLAKCAEARGLSIKGIDIVLDGWYCCEEVLKKLRNLGYIVTTKPAKDDKFKINGEWLTVAELKIKAEKEKWRQSMQLPANYLYQRYYAFSPFYGDVVLVVRRKINFKTGREEIKVLMNTDISATSIRIIRNMETRWDIEVFFKDSKQFCGWTKLQFSCSTSIQNHFALRCLTYTVLALYRKKFCRRKTTSIKKCRDAICPMIYLYGIKDTVNRSLQEKVIQFPSPIHVIMQNNAMVA